MTVLVLGAGLIGGLTAQLLAQRGDKVVLADVRDGAAPDGVLRVRCDVTDEPALKTLMQNHGVRDVVHTAAWLSTAIRQDPLKGIGVNIMNINNNICINGNTKRSLHSVCYNKSCTAGWLQPRATVIAKHSYGLLGRIV